MARRSPSDPKRWANPNNRGNGLCYATDPKCKKLLKEKGLDGIVYNDFEPDFKPVAEASVSIQHMTTQRTTLGRWSDPGGDAPIIGNFQQADLEAAIQWTKARKDGRTWTAKDVRKYREANELTWHECGDGHSMDLVPECINDHFAHTGGVSMWKEVEKVLEQTEDCTEGLEGADISRYNPETDTFDDDPTSEDPAPAARSDHGFCPMQLVVTGGMLVMLVVTSLLSDCSSFLRTLLWFVSTLTPYAALLVLCVKWKGLPKVFRSRTGGIVLLVLFTAVYLLVPTLTEVLFGICLIVTAFFVLKVVGIFAPNGLLTITRQNADGSTTQETRAFYGSAEAALSQAESDLRAEGYEDIRRGA